jgi:probable phosphoglycerate mutase
MILCLVRHGESVFNIEGRIQGRLDVALSPLGIRQAAAVADALAAEADQNGAPFDAIYSSPLSRALETAHAIAARLSLEARIDPGLQKIHAGVFQGLTREEMDERFPAESKRWSAREPDFRIPDGETRRELMIRGVGALRAIRAAGHDRAIVVSHGGLLSAALKGLLEIPVNRGPFHFYNAAITRLLWQDEPIVDTFNDTAHLRQFGKGGFGDL